MNRVLLTVLSAITMLWITSCAAPGPTANVNVFSAPVDANVAGVRSIGVNVFENDSNEAFSRALETIIANVTLIDKDQQSRNTVRVVGLDRTRSISRQSLDPAALGSAAKRLDVDAILTGEIVVSTSDSRPYKSTKSVCTRTVTKKDKKGNNYDVCEASADVPISCVKNTANVQVNYRLISRDGQVLTRKSAQAKDEDDACEGKRVKPAATSGSFLEILVQNANRDIGGPITSQAVLLARAYGVVAQDIKDQLIPQQKMLKVEWLADSAGIKNPMMKERFESGVKFAAAARADRACEIFREIYVTEQQSSALHYNVGLCDEIDGQVEVAQKKYHIADKMLLTPNLSISAAVARTFKQVQTIDKIAEKRPDLLDSAAIAGGKKKVNPIVVGREGIDPKILATMKSERRVALVIGNQAYATIGALRNAAKDAKDVEAALKEVGFTVISGYDLTHTKTTELLARFKSNLRKGDVAVVYFAGHGIGIEGANFLLPVDFQGTFAKTAVTAGAKSLHVQGKLEEMLKAAGPRFLLIVADACRNLPSITSSTRSIEQGLKAPKTVAKGSLVLYSTGAGQTAEDGAGDNGLFTSYFLQAVRTPNVTIKDAMEWVASSVSTESNGLQVPATYDNRVGDFYFSVK